MESIVDDENDDFLCLEDKKNLLIYIKNKYSENYKWADKLLIKALVKEHYKNVVKKIDREEYKRDKAREHEADSILDSLDDPADIMDNLG